MMEYRRIGDLTTVITGGTPSTNVPEYWEDGNIPWLQSGCCQNCDVEHAEKCITQLGYDNSSTKMMPSDTVMIALTGATAGKIGYLKFNACGNQSITGILPCDMLDQKYLFYFLLSQRDKILADCVGGAQAHISQGYVKDILVPVLPLVEQKVISKNMSIIDELIFLRKQQLSKLDELVKSRFIEMFGDVANSPKYSGIPLGAVCTTLSGGTPTTKVPEYYEGDIPWISTPYLGNNHIDGSSAKAYITEDAIKNSATHLIPENTIMFGIRVGVGKSSIIDEPMCANQDIVALMGIDTSKYNLLFVKHVLDGYQSHFDSIKKGATILGITTEDLKKVLIPVVDMNVQNRFASFVEQTDKSKLEIQKSLNQLETLKKALMQKYFG